MRTILIGFALALGLGRAAGAHAFLDHADPKVGSHVAAPPAEVRLWFTQAVEPSLSTISVGGPTGFGGVGPAKPAADASELDAALRRPIPVGRYVVRWRVVSVDSHMTEGDFSFEVGP